MTSMLYVVVDKDGEIVRRRGKPLVFLTQRGAENRCRWDGDSVVPLVFDTAKDQPVYIVGRTLTTGV